MRQIGRELGVRYALEGSVRRSGNRLRIMGQLVDATSGAHIWADRFDGDAGDVFALQDRTVGQGLDDTSASTQVKMRLMGADHTAFRGVDVEVAEGNLLLSGVVPDEQDGHGKSLVRRAAGWFPC